MAQETIGALRVILGMDTAAFEKGTNEAQKKMRAAERHFQKMGRKIQDVGAKMSVAITGSITVLGGMAAQAANSLVELDNLATIAGVSVERFKVLSLAARNFGIGQEKLSDVLKDVNDKFGDYLQTGAGPLADFFENIAPKVGLTADEFKGLSSEQALGKYIKALEDANVNQQEMTFYLEAIASDSTALLPIFKNNSAAIEEYTNKAKSMGLSIDRDMVEKAKKAREEFTFVAEVLKTNMQAALVDLLPVIVELGNTFVPVLKKIVSGIQGLANWFSNLDAKQQKMIVMFTAIAAVAGPVIIALGAMVAAVTVLLGPVGLLIAAIVGAGGLVYALHELGGASDIARKAHEELNDVISKSQVLRSQAIAITKEAAKAQYEEAMAVRANIKEKADAYKKELEIAIEQQKKAGILSSSVPGTIANAAAKLGRESAIGRLQKLLKDANKELIESDRHLLNIQKRLYDLSTGKVFSSGDKPVPSKPPGVKTETKTPDKSTSDDNGPEAQSYDDAQAEKRLRAAYAMIEARKKLNETTKQEIEDNALLAEALKKGGLEYEIVAEQIRRMNTGLYKSIDATRAAAEAVVKSREKIKQVGDAIEKEREKLRREQEERARLLSNVKGAFSDGVRAAFDGNLGSFIKNKLRDIASNMFDRAIDKLIDALFNIDFGKGDGKGLGGLISSGIGFLFGGKREKGGPVMAGRAYVVGEKRPEMFVPGQSGRIIPSIPTGGGIAQIVPSPYFDVVVADRAARVTNAMAPNIARAETSKAFVRAGSQVSRKL